MLCDIHIWVNWVWWAWNPNTLDSLGLTLAQANLVIPTYWTNCCWELKRFTGTHWKTVKLGGLDFYLWNFGLIACLLMRQYQWVRWIALLSGFLPFLGVNSVNFCETESNWIAIEGVWVRAERFRCNFQTGSPVHIVDIFGRITQRTQTQSKFALTYAPARMQS